ncbi:hypothetical protein CSUI_001523 [Cystoisospora suis]|uniref:Uncharacterized protein n=1 Tax=Cystoisospora suis TaxID=483139 RepID=A0A2C6KX61_9APIC|nr:hypothetical protein CSUI_001523 [Cystoisospora suis]
MRLRGVPRMHCSRQSLEDWHGSVSLKTGNNPLPAVESPCYCYQGGQAIRAAD